MDTSASRNRSIELRVESREQTENSKLKTVNRKQNTKYVQD